MDPRLSICRGTSLNEDITVSAVPPENPPLTRKAEVHLPILASGPKMALIVSTDVNADASLGMESKHDPGTIQAPFFHARKSYLMKGCVGILQKEFLRMISLVYHVGLPPCFARDIGIVSAVSGTCSADKKR